MVKPFANNLHIILPSIMAQFNSMLKIMIMWSLGHSLCLTCPCSISCLPIHHPFIKILHPPYLLSFSSSVPPTSYLHSFPSSPPVFLHPSTLLPLLPICIPPPSTLLPPPLNRLLYKYSHYLWTCSRHHKRHNVVVFHYIYRIFTTIMLYSSPLS